jgi:hypothetical protein
MASVWWSTLHTSASGRPEPATSAISDPGRPVKSGTAATPPRPPRGPRGRRGPHAPAARAARETRGARARPRPPAAPYTAEPIAAHTSTFAAIRFTTAVVNSVVPALPPRSGVLMPAATVSKADS